VRYELGAYADVLAEKPEIVVLNKIDALTPDELKAKVKALKKASKAEVHTISGATGQGVEQVLFDVLAVIDESRAEEEKVLAPKTEEKWTP
jgi:GTP-binding protein